MKSIYKIIFIISVALVVVSAVTLSIYGLNLGVDFKGGSVSEIVFNGLKPEPSVLEEYLLKAHPKITNVDATLSGEKSMIIRFNTLDEVTHRDMVQLIANQYGSVTELKFDSIGPTIGEELKSQSITAILLTLVAIGIYITIVFRGMSVVLSPWVMGVAAILALIHDVIIPLGIFALLGHYAGIEITAIFVAAILTILGYSISDTVIVFDRIRENVIRREAKESFSEIAHKSVKQTMTRSINTSMTTILALVAVYFFGGESVKYFALALIIGIVLGTYSSIFVATPIVVWWRRRTRK
jgi:preprotein translocase subunit SecF